MFASGADMLAEVALDLVQQSKDSRHVAIGADMLTGLVAVECCGPDAALNAVQHCEYSTHASDKSRYACRICC